MPEILKMHSARLFGEKTINLTSRGPRGWRKYAYPGASPNTEENYMASAPVSIPSWTPVNCTPTYDNSPPSCPGNFTWTNSAGLHASGSAVRGHLEFGGAINSGATIAIPMTTDRQTVKLYITVKDAAITLTAALTGGTTPSTNVVLTKMKGYARYVITIHAAAADNSSRVLNITANNPSATGKFGCAAIALSGALVNNGFLALNDNGAEGAATSIATQNTNPTVNTGAAFRNRRQWTADVQTAPETVYEAARTDSQSDSALAPVEGASSGFNIIPVPTNLLKIPDDTAFQTYTSQNGAITLTKTQLDALGMVSGDYLFVFQAYYKTTDTSGIATDGTLNGGQTWTNGTVARNGNVSGRVSYCKFDGSWDDISSGNSLKFTPDGGGTNAFTIYLVPVSGVDATTAIDAGSTTPANATYGTPSQGFTVAGVTTVTPGALVLTAVMIPGSQGLEGNNGEINAAEIDGSHGAMNTGTGGCGIQVYAKQMPAAGASGNLITYKASAASGNGLSIALALKPAAKANNLIYNDSTYVTDGQATTNLMA